MKTTVFAVLGTLLLAGTAHAAVADCKVSKLAELPVTMHGLRPLVHAQINGRDAEFLTDSGAWYSMISPGNAAEFGLTLTQAPTNLRMGGVGGQIVPKVAMVQRFTLAGANIPNIEFLVGGSEVGAVGLLGQNVLALGDTEFDLAHGVIRLMRSEKCGKADFAYWVSPGQSYSVLETLPDFRAGVHIVGAVYVNGKKFYAIFDTGASTTVMTRAAADLLGLNPDSPGVKPAGFSGGIGRSITKTWTGPVSSIKIGDEEIHNTRIRFGDIGVGADMLIGADFFLSHHVYWARKQGRLYFSYNGGPVFNLSYLREDENSSQKSSAVVANAMPVSGNKTSSNDDDPAPTDAEGLSRRGAARQARGEFSDARTDFDQAIKLAPTDIDYLRQRASLSMEMRQPLKAVSDLDQLLTIKPDDVDALLMRVEAKRKLDRKADVSHDLNTAAAALPNSSDRHLTVATLYASVDDFADAIGQYDLWIAAHPQDNRQPTALNGVCWARAMANVDLDRALKDCNKALFFAGKDAKILDSRGMVHLRRGEYAFAIWDYNAAIKAEPDTAWSHYGRGIAELKLGKRAEGEADIALAKSKAPDLADQAKKLGIVP